MLKKFKITVDGRPYEVTVEDVSESPSLIIPQESDMPQTASVAAPAAAAAAPAAASAASAEAGENDVLSPLGGVVVSIDVSEGQAVNEGDKVVTLEAMKMKTIVAAKRSGTVRNIAVKAGDGVEAGQILMSVE